MSHLKIVPPAETTGWLRLLEVGAKRYKKGGDANAARIALQAALALLVHHVGAADTALLTAEYLSTHAQIERSRKARR
jgi:hypothetical protein